MDRTGQERETEMTKCPVCGGTDFSEDGAMIAAGTCRCDTCWTTLEWIEVNGREAVQAVR